MKISARVGIFMMILCVAGYASVELDFKKACQQDSLAAYAKFLHKHPNSQYEADVKGRIEEIYWREASSNKSGSTAGYSAYLARYPKGKYSTEAARYIADTEWEDASSKKDLKPRMLYMAAQKYLEAQPAGTHAAEAQAILKKLEDVVGAELKREAAFREGMGSASSRGQLEDLIRQYSDLEIVGEAIFRLETAIINEIKRDGPGDRFVIPSILPITQSPGGEGERICFIGNEKSGVSMGGLYPGDGSITMRSVNADGKNLTLPGCVWRFIGEVGIGSHLFQGSDNTTAVLTFYLEPKGLVYIRGRGKVILPSGETVNLGDK